MVPLDLDLQRTAGGDAITQAAVGGLRASQDRDRIRAGEDPKIVFDSLIELADRYGLQSAAVAAFVVALSKGAR